MRLLFKFIGLFFILSVCTTAGFIKALTLKNRLDSLNMIKSGLLKLKEQLRLKSGNKNRLLKNCFSVFPDDLSDLTKDDKTLWSDFLADFGKGDTKQEYDRCTVFITLFGNEITKAEAVYNEQQKLYKSLGFLSGVFVCIFFL